MIDVYGEIQKHMRKRAYIVVVICTLVWLFRGHAVRAQKYETNEPAEVNLLDKARVERFDFEQKGIEGRRSVDGNWTVEEMPRAPSGKKVLVQRARVEPPALGQWPTLRVVALANYIQAYLNGRLLHDHRDSRFRSGQIGLWTKADSVTAFDDLMIKSYNSK